MNGVHRPSACALLGAEVALWSHHYIKVSWPLSSLACHVLSSPLPNSAQQFQTITPPALSQSIYMSDNVMQRGLDHGKRSCFQDCVPCLEWGCCGGKIVSWDPEGLNACL